MPCVSIATLCVEPPIETVIVPVKPPPATFKRMLLPDTVPVALPVALKVRSSQSPESRLPETSSLLGIYPNPSNSRIVVDFQLSHSASVNLRLYDLSGSLAKILIDNTFAEGYRWHEHDLSGLSSGIYICIFSVDGTIIDTEKVLLVK